jgi:hypothetical protein
MLHVSEASLQRIAFAKGFDRETAELDVKSGDRDFCLAMTSRIERPEELDALYP